MRRLANVYTLSFGILVSLALTIYLIPPKKRSTCANISVICTCPAELCRCGDLVTCSESCYQEARRQGRVK